MAFLTGVDLEGKVQAVPRNVLGLVAQDHQQLALPAPKSRWIRVDEAAVPTPQEASKRS